MAISRNVYRTGKDENKNITALCNSAAYWSPRSKVDAISDIEGGDYEYLSNGKTKIIVFTSVTGAKHLRTVPNSDSDDNLDNLPDC